MTVHPFYKENQLRVHEIPVGSKCPIEKGWPTSNRDYQAVEQSLSTARFNKYGWLLDDSHIVIDIDLHNEKENGNESLKTLEENIGVQLDDVCGAVVYSPSGGRHYYFTKPPAVKLGKVFKDKYPGIDFISGQGKQVVAANSCHDDYPGQAYTLSESPVLVEIPNVLLRHLESQRTAVPVVPPQLNDDRSGDEFNTSQRGLELMVGELRARGYIVRQVDGYYEFDRPGKSTGSKCSGHVGKKSSHGNFQLCCFSLSDSFFPSGESISLFHAYSLLCAGGDHKTAASQLFFRGFAQEPESLPRVDLSGLEPIKEIYEKPDSRPQLDPETIEPPGLLGDMVRFVRETARYDLPEVTLASCLAFSGMVLGRRVRAIDDTRPNLFCLSIAESGTGKNHPRQTIKRMMHQAGIDVPREGAASAAGVARMLSRTPTAVLQIDEAGLAFRAMKNPRSPQAELAGLLSELFTSSNGFFSYRAYADSSNECPVDQPHLSINAITTEQQLYAGGFSHEDIEQGLFGRFLLFRPANMDPEERFDLEVQPVPGSIIERIESWWEFRPWDAVAGANLQPDHPEPMVVPFTDAAKRRYREYAKAITKKMRSEDTFRKALWRRSKEKTSRLALVHACMKDGHRAGIVVDRDSMDWAIKVSNYSTRGMVYDMENAMVESKYQADAKYFLDKIPHGGIERWRLNRKTNKFKKKERDEIFADLVSTGRIYVEEIPTGGTPKLIVKRSVGC